MENMIRLVGPERAVEFLGIRLVGVNATNGTKLLFTLVFIVAVLLLGALLRRLSRRVLRKRDDRRAEFWVGQGIKVATTSLQKVVTAVAGYFVILRGRTFNVGDRIVMGVYAAT